MGVPKGVDGARVAAEKHHPLSDGVGAVGDEGGGRDQTSSNRDSRESAAVQLLQKMAKSSATLKELAAWAVLAKS